MNIRNISKVLNELSGTIQIIPLFSTTLIISIGGLSVLFIISVLCFCSKARKTLTMGKKKSKKVKSGGKPSGEKLKEPVHVIAQTETEEKFNFGALPDINFKKNFKAKKFHSIF